MSQGPAYLTTRQVAEVLQVHPKHVYRLLRRGLPAMRMGGEWRFIEEDVRSWVGEGSQRRVAKAPEPTAVASPAAGVPAVLVADADPVVESLLVVSSQLGAPYVGHMQADRTRGLELLHDGVVLAACYDTEPPEATGVARSLVRVHLARREIGLTARSPRSIPSLKALVGRRFVSRAPGSDVRATLDRALEAAGLEPEQLHGSARVASSHLEVVLAVARGEVDVGVTTQSWSRRLRLAFAPLATVDFGLQARAAQLDDSRFLRLLAAARSRAFRGLLNPLGGCDAARAGEIQVLTAHDSD